MEVSYVSEAKYIINDGMIMTYEEWLEMRKAEMDR